MADPPEVRELIERARTGDAEAWDLLYRRSYPRLLAYAGRRLPTSDDARDAVGEAVIRAVAGLDRYRAEGANFDAWLYGILRHVVLDLQRAGSRRSAEEVPELIDDAPPALDRLVAGEDAAAVRAAFSGLSPADQELLELRVVAGLRSEEVAGILGRKAGAVRMAQARALDRLRDLLGEEVARGR